MVSESFGSMETREKSNAEFRSDVHEILATHESRFKQILNELHALRLQQSQITTETRPTSEKDINSFLDRRAHV